MGYNVWGFMRLIQIFMFSAFFCIGAHAETITCTGIPHASLPITRTSRVNPFYKDAQPPSMKHWELLKAPPHRLIGSVLIEGIPDGATNYVGRLQIHEALDKDLLPPKSEEDNNLVWFEAMELISPHAPLRALRYELVQPLAGGTNEVPIRLPDLEQGIFRCRFDVISPDGTIVASITPAEIYEGSHRWEMRQNSTQTAWIADTDATAKQIIASQAGMNQSFTVNPLPGNWRDLQSVRAIWVNRAIPFDNRLLRRLILSGRWILGQPEEMDSIHKRLGTKGQYPILSGGIASLQQQGPALRVDFNADTHFNEFSPYDSHDDASWPFENNQALFSRIRFRYLTFTLVAAGIYALCATIFLPFFFRKLSGNNRLQIWWKTPLIVGIYSIVVLLVGLVWVQPKRPITNVTEYRYGYADWPEVFCLVDFEAFKFGTPDLGWATAPGFMIGQLDKANASSIKVTDHGNQPGKVMLSGVSRGLRVESETAYFREEQQPFKVTRDEKSLTILTRRNLRNIHLALNNDQWLAIGDMPAGESITLTEDHFDMATLNQSQEVRMLDVVRPRGLPGSLERMLDNFGSDSVSVKPIEVTKKDCENCGKDHMRSGDRVRLVADSAILIALDENENAGVQSVHPETWRQSRVAWITQVPADDAVTHTAGEVE